MRRPAEARRPEARAPERVGVAAGRRALRPRPWRGRRRGFGGLAGLLGLALGVGPVLGLTGRLDRALAAGGFLGRQVELGLVDSGRGGRARAGFRRGRTRLHVEHRPLFGDRRNGAHAPLGLDHDGLGAPMAEALLDRARGDRSARARLQSQGRAKAGAGGPYCRCRRSFARFTHFRIQALRARGGQRNQHVRVTEASSASARSRLLAPTLRKERTEARQTLDILCPAFGASPRKEGEVYHIFQAQGQTQFARGKAADQPWRLGLALGDPFELVSPVGRSVGRFDHPGRAARSDGGRGPVESPGKVARPPRKAEAGQKALFSTDIPPGRPGRPAA